MARKRKVKNNKEEVKNEKLKKFSVRGKDGKSFTVEAANLKEVYNLINNQQ